MLNAFLLAVIIVLVILTIRGHLKNRKEASVNHKLEQAFMTENQNEEGVEQLPSGVQILWQEQHPENPSPDANSKVKVHYQGTLLDGTEFDNSHKRGKPLEFKLNQVVPGWQHGLQKMHVGDVATLYIPSRLAYGSRRVGKIAPASMLIFKVELLEIS